MSHLINMRRVALPLAIFAIVGFGSAALAKADSVTLNLNVLPAGSSLPGGGYGTISLTLNNTNGIDVTVALSGGAKVINGGQDCSICFNSSLSTDPTISLGSPAITAGYGLMNSGGPTTIHADGFGDFEYGVNFLGSTGGACTSDATPCVSTVSFTVTRVGGFTSVNDLIENSTGGGTHVPFAVDLIMGDGSGRTGFVGTGSPIPEPATMLLLGTGLIGVAAGVRRHLRR